MKKMKKMIAIIAIVGMLAIIGAVFADGLKTPADILSALTGKTTAELSTERAAGKTYGAMAKEAGKLDAFQKQMLEQKKVILDQRVKDGKLTQKQADDIYSAIKNNQATCDGTGNAKIGKKAGICFGNGTGMGNGMGRGMGKGCGMQNGGCGMNSTCNNQNTPIQ